MCAPHSGARDCRTLVARNNCYYKVNDTKLPIRVLVVTCDFSTLHCASVYTWGRFKYFMRRNAPLWYTVP